MTQYRFLQLNILLVSLVSNQFLFSRDKNDRIAVSVTEENRKKEDVKQGAKPKNSHISLENKLEKKFIYKIDKTISFLEETRKGIPQKSDANLDILFRIMSLRMEQAIYVQNQEFDEFDMNWQRWESRGKVGAEPVCSSSKSNEIWKNVVKIGIGISQDFKNNKYDDKILFNLASAYQYLNDESRSIASFTGLIEKYPASNLVPDSHFSIGEHLFIRGDFANAILHYKENLKEKVSTKHGWALYKLGWCYYNLGQYQTSVDIWKDTISYSKTMDEKIGSRLRSDVFKDMPYSYAELSQLNEAVEFYTASRGEEYLPNLYKLMATIFFSQGKYGRSIFVWKKLIQLDPLSVDALKYQLEIISIENQRKNFSNVLAENEWMMKEYGPASKWNAAKKPDDPLVYKKSIYFCKLIHKQAQITNDRSIYEQAKSCYASFLNTFAHDKREMEITEYMGDIEYFLGDYAKSGAYYEKITVAGKESASVYNEEDVKVGNNHERCAANMLDAFNKNFSDEFSKLIKRPVDENATPLKISESATLFLTGCSTYQKFYPSDKKAIKNCDLIESEIYYRSAIRDKAKKQLYEIAVRYAADKEGVIAAENLILYYKGDKQKLMAVARALHKIPAYASGPFGDKLYKLIRATEVDVITSQPPSIARGKAYEARAHQYPKDPDADKYLYNAASDYLAYGNAAEAIRIYILILASYPESSASEDTLLQLAKLQEAVLDFSAASLTYQRYAEKYSSQKESEGAYKKACDLQMAIDSSQSTQVCKSFALRYQKEEKTILQALIVSKIRSEKKSEAISLLTQDFSKYLTSTNEKIFYYYSLYQLQGGADSISSILALPQQKEELESETVLHYGEILFQNAFPVVDKIRGTVLQGGTVEALQKSIQKLTELMAEADRLFGRLLLLQDPYWGVAAFYELGVCYELFAEKLKNPPVIEGAKPEDVKSQLKNSVNELQTKSEEYYKVGYETAEKFSIYNEFSAHLSYRHMHGKGKGEMAWWVDDPIFFGFYTESIRIKNMIGGAKHE